MSIIRMCHADAAPIREASCKQGLAVPNPSPRAQWWSAPSHALLEAHLRRARVEVAWLRRLSCAPRQLEPSNAAIIKDRV
jgi:hypothetical protein